MATIAQWNGQRLPSCGPGFESQPSVYAFSIYIVQIVYLSFKLVCEKNENKPKEAGISPFFKNEEVISLNPYMSHLLHHSNKLKSEYQGLTHQYLRR